MTANLQPPIESFPLRATMNVRDAMAAALVRVVEGVRFTGAQGTDRFAQVFDDWPSFNEKYVPPAACILPGEFKFTDSQFSPKLIESTWWPQYFPGWGLYKVSEVQADFQLVLRTNLVGERKAIMHAVEDAFQASGMTMNEAQGGMYGLTAQMPDYYNQCVTFALLGGSVIDSEDKVMREQREAAYTVTATAARVQVGPVFPLVGQTILKINGDAP